MLPRILALLLALATLLSACGDADPDSESSVAETVGSDSGDEIATSDSNEDDESDRPTAEIVDFGFGQSSSAVTGIVLVTSDDEDIVGKFVTVSTNFLDAQGQIISTEDQIETFSWAGQQVAFPIFLYLPDLPRGTSVASIDPVVTVGDGFDEEARPPLPVLEATEIRKSRSEGYTVSFGFTNESDEDLSSLRVGAVCYDATGKVVGGDTTYPDSVPVGRAIRIDVDYLVVSAEPASCKAFLNYPA
jgi:hypothetical protein